MRALLPLLLALAACAPTDGSVGRGALADAPLAAPGHARGEGVDPSVVGDRLTRAGEHELALAAYMRAAAKDGLDTGAKLAIASSNVRLGRLGQAERILRDVLGDEPRNAAAMNDLGVVLLQQGEPGEATRVLRAAFALQPDPEILANLQIAETRLAARTYPDPVQDDAFTLTRRGGGVYDLAPPDAR